MFSIIPDIIVKGGPVMIPILAGSVVGLSIVIERFWLLHRMRLNASAFERNIFRFVRGGEIGKAISLCEEYGQHPLAAVAKIGLERRDLPPAMLEKVLEQAGNNEIMLLERHLGILASIIGIEPLLGFLGTITGLIRAFMSWEKAGADVTVSVLASGIYEAMITTAAGLIVAIPLYLCYNYFVSRIRLSSNELANHCLQLLEVIAGTRPAPAP